MTKILIIIGTYLPGYKAGGPVQTVKNLTDCMGDEYDFYILTADRDLGDSAPYDDIRYRAWNQLGKAKVWYVKPGGFSASVIRHLSEDVGLVYVCGLFSDYSRTVMHLKRSGRLSCPVVIAPMGIFSQGAFRLKRRKKELYIAMCRLMGWFRDVIWSASNEQEVADTRRLIGKNAACMIAQDIPRRMLKRPQSIGKEAGKLRLVFLSRISPKKNLKYAIELLENLKGQVLFDIYGVMEDREYYSACMQQAQRLPSNIRVSYKGAISPEEAVGTFSQYHAFLFPSRGENYGHVIYEAMAGGCIPLLSDRTPWQELEAKKIGRVIPLEDRDAFQRAIQELLDMPREEYEKWHDRLTDYAWECSCHIDDTGYRRIFDMGAIKSDSEH